MGEWSRSFASSRATWWDAISKTSKHKKERRSSSGPLTTARHFIIMVMRGKLLYEYDFFPIMPIFSQELHFTRHIFIRNYMTWCLVCKVVNSKVVRILQSFEFKFLHKLFKTTRSPRSTMESHVIHTISIITMKQKRLKLYHL